MMNGAVPNTQLIVAKSLRYDNANGDQVQRLYPLDYLILVGQVAGRLVDSDSVTKTTLENFLNRITALENINIPTQYTTPEINGHCINGNETEAIDTLLETFITTWCTYVGVTGSATDLTNAINAQTVNNAAAAYAGGNVGSLSGWVASPTKVSDTLKNIWVLIQDIRTGLTSALSYATPKCKDIIVDFDGTITDSGNTFNMYLRGYTFVPQGFADTYHGSTITITDSSGNIYTSSIDVTSGSTSTSPIVFDLTGSSLYPVSDYTVSLLSSITNGSLTCEKTTIKKIINSTNLCPGVNSMSASSTGIQIIYSPVIKSSVNYVCTLYESDGTTIVQTITTSDPSGLFTVTFTGLTSTTAYKVGMTGIYLNMEPVVCSPLNISTTS